MLLSAKHQFLFIHIQRTGGTSVEEALRPFCSTPPLPFWIKLLRNLRLAPPVLTQPDFYYPTHSTALELRQTLGKRTFGSLYKFAFVRNPWDLEVSLYFDILQDPEHRQNGLVKKMSGFEEYLEWRFFNGWTPQKMFVADGSGKVIVDFVGRFENLEEDFKKVCDKIEVEATLPHLNKTQHLHYRDYYNQRSRYLIEKSYHSDIELFGYKF